MQDKEIHLQLFSSVQDCRGEKKTMDGNRRVRLASLNELNRFFLIYNTRKYM